MAPGDVARQRGAAGPGYESGGKSNHWLPIDSTWIWSEGSGERDVSRRKVGALVIIRSGESREPGDPGSLLSSTRAERMAMRAALEEGSTVAGDLATGPVVLCTDSQAALTTVAGGPRTQTTRRGATVWSSLRSITERGRRVTLLWVPAHCGIPGNEREDDLAREAASLPQKVPADTRSMTGIT